MKRIKNLLLVMALLSSITSFSQEPQDTIFFKVGRTDIKPVKFHNASIGVLTYKGNEYMVTANEYSKIAKVLAKFESCEVYLYKDKIKKY